MQMTDLRPEFSFQDFKNHLLSYEMKIYGVQQ